MEDDAQLGDTLGPVPLSFPAVLRNPKLADRFAHLRTTSQDSPGPQSLQCRAKKDRQEREGKRWVRRRENAKFAHNPHVALPTSLDYTHPLQVPSSTFPRPLPAYLPRSAPLPAACPPPSPASSSTAGLFSVSLRGTRRALRANPSAAPLVSAIEAHLVAWLEGGTYLNPDQAKGLFQFPGDPVGGREDIREVSREAGRLIWAVKADSPLESSYGSGGFERRVVHCVARWYGVVSFSKDADGCRLTYLLRPNVTRPDPRFATAARRLDTPPTTDASDFHVSDASLSDSNTTDASDVDSVNLSADADQLADIQESRPVSPDSWFGTDFSTESDKGRDDDAEDRGFAASMESLSLSAHADAEVLAASSADRTLTPSRLWHVASATRRDRSDAEVEVEELGENSTPSRARADQVGLHGVYPRSASSPSPVGRPPRRFTARKVSARRQRRLKNNHGGLAGALGTEKGTFYDYLFA